MCFSPQMDVAAGVVVGGLGLEAVRHVRRPLELPLACLPLAFGAHQLTEAFVWWGLMGQVAPETGQAARWLYMAFAFVVLPSVVPVAVLLVEEHPRRRGVIGRFAALGALVSVAYAGAMLHGPVGATIHGRTIAYDTGISHGGVVALLYMVACVGALISSGHRRIAAFGTANLVALPVLVFASSRALTSLWCVWAAVASVIIVDHMRLPDRVGDLPPLLGRHRPGWARSDWFERLHLDR